jgi:hypothetical protein
VFEGSEDMQKCCVSKRFYTLASPLFGGGYAIGSISSKNLVLPDVYPTHKAAMEEQEEMEREYRIQIEANERDADDEWDADILEIIWDGVNHVVKLVEDDTVIHEEDWRSMAGLI